MEFGICPLSVVPIRSGASDKSEMVSQLLFGELVEIIERRASWLKVRCTWDNYLGWADQKQIKLISNSDFEFYSTGNAYSIELVQAAMSDGHALPITIGATLPHFDGLRFRLNGSSYQFSGQAIYPLDVDPGADMLLKLARRYLYAPYLWGGRSPMGIDCSGFTQIVFKMIGIHIPRDAAQQVAVGESVDFVEQAQAGDLAFFENRKGKIVHVGIIMPDGEIIHASGQVRIDRLDHYGIFRSDQSKYTHRLRVIKRLLPKYTRNKTADQQNETNSSNQVQMFSS